MKRSTNTISIILIFFLIIAAVIIGRTMIGNHFKKKFSKRPPPGIIVTEVVNKEFAEIKDVVENWSEYQNTEKTLTDLENLINDDEMKDMATEEKLNCEERLRQLESEIMIQLLPKD